MQSMFCHRFEFEGEQCHQGMASGFHDPAFGGPYFWHLPPRGRCFTLKADGAPRGQPVERLHRTQMRTGDKIGAHGSLALPDGKGVVDPADLAGLGADQSRGSIGLPHRPGGVPPKGRAKKGDFNCSPVIET